MLVLYGIFAFQNPFNNAKVTAFRGVVAVLVGWAKINNSRMLGALSFGWAYALIFIELIWGAVYLLRYVKDKNNFNSKLIKS